MLIPVGPAGANDGAALLTAGHADDCWSMLQQEALETNEIGTYAKNPGNAE